MLEFKLKWNYKTEKAFTTDFLKEFKKKWWAYKISDLARTIKPFDWFWVCEKWVIFCETKIIEDNIFKFSQIRNNQYTALLRISKQKEKYNLKNIYSVIQIYSKRHDDYIFIDFAKIKDYMNKWYKEIKVF
jgi:hypothetical protein